MFRSISEDEDDDDDMTIRYRPRTGSLSEHEDLLALQAQAEAVAEFKTKKDLGSFSADEAGYEVSLIACHLTLGNACKTSILYVYRLFLCILYIADTLVWYRSLC